MFNRNHDSGPGHTIVGYNGSSVKLGKYLVTPVRWGDDTVDVKVARKHTEFAQSPWHSLRVGDPVPGVRGWKVTGIERRPTGDDVPAGALVGVTYGRQ